MNRTSDWSSLHFTYRENNVDCATEEVEKMVFVILLLLFLTPCISGTFVVNVTQASYQAEENQNITLEWTFSTRRDTSLRSISTICELHTESRPFVLFHLHQGIESPESQDPQFAGRVQWDKDVLTEGRLTLHVSRLRINDSGFYVCDILVRPDGSNSRRCWLNVTAAEELEPQRPTERPHLEILIWVIFGLLPLGVVLSVSYDCMALIKCNRRTHNTDGEFIRETNHQDLSPSESEHRVRLSNI
ncbi:CD276 antigen-like isoform X2 [Pseudochaenichthys georgianus]|uniref:CD276 antigen-like isoform X2 n=1 Tax=Pseudochaenichthys georgianus TaxID=52239 RepID=UPI00146EEA00|nr:uncharacterized protein LOC117453769 isoform X2 [Pseudochaenichthys georgianus]